MLTSAGAILIGLVVGLRHALEPDHLSAVSTLVAEGGGARRGALLGAIWGLGHTMSLLAVGVVLMIAGAVMPERLAAGFELAVAIMLIGLGVRALLRARREGASGPVSTHRHGALEHRHAAAPEHVHLGARALAWRPLLIGMVHGLAGSGALTALVFAELHGAAPRIAYVVLFGLGSIAGMAIASGLAGASLGAFARGGRARRRLSVATGAIAIVIGIGWAVPVVGVLV